MNSILYIVSIIFLFIMFLLVKKSNKKLNLFAHIFLNFVLVFCYNVFICYFNNLVSIPITLLNLALENIIFAIIIMSYILKNKTIQKFKCSFNDILAVSIIIFIAFIILVLTYRIPIGAKFLVVDGSNHFNMAKNFWGSTSLRENGTSRPGSYINIGIWFKVFEPFIGYMNLMKVFVLFDWGQWLIEALLFYFIVQKYGKKDNDFLNIIFSIIYMLGYSLHSLLTGFVYLSSAMLIIISLIYVLNEYKTKELKEWYRWSLLFLFVFGVAFTYYFFLPVVIFSIFINELIDCKKNNNKIISKRNILFVIIIFIIPTCCCFQFHFLSRLFLKQDNVSSIEYQMTLEGYIERSYFSNFICFMPMVLIELFYSLKRIIKKKDYEIDFDFIFFCILMMFTIAMGILNLFGKLSYYGFFKCYYVLAITIIIMFAKGCMHFVEKEFNNKIFVYFYIVLYISVIIIYAFSVNELICVVFKESLIDKSLYNIGHIYRVNRSFIQNIDGEFYKEENEVLNYIYENIDYKNKKLLIIGNDRQIPWIKYIFNLDYLENGYTEEDYYKWISGNTEDYDYLLILESAKIYFRRFNIQWNTIDENFNCIIGNSRAKLYQK